MRSSLNFRRRAEGEYRLETLNAPLDVGRLLSAEPLSQRQERQVIGILRGGHSMGLVAGNSHLLFHLLLAFISIVIFLRKSFLFLKADAKRSHTEA